ncbi:MAG: hypothetical protein CVU44_04870 [Chloroflexi bacterium HGW-Chloroflexi-6]|nr:MAG: hypothetical protein CVU44_04870 [Chloroflexi bacterium HGW-Chloroflexi-6]
MRHFLIGLLILSIFLSGCGTVSVKINWNPDEVPSIVTVTPTAYLTADWTADFASAALSPSPTAIFTATPWEASTPSPSGETPTPPAAVTLGAPLAYVSQDRIYWVDPGGNIYPLSDSAYAASSPLVSPDNSLVVYFESRSGSVLEGLLLKDIVLASTSRSFEPRTLVGDSSDRLLSFSPDGQWVLTQRAEFKQPVGLFYYGLHVINVITGEDREVLALLGFPNDPPILPVNPTWSPDSQYIFFDRKPASGEWPPRLELNVVNIHTREMRLLLDVNQSGSLAFSPDGSRLLVAGPRQLFRFDLEQVYDFSVDAPAQLLMSYDLPQEGTLIYTLPQLRWNGPERIFLALPWQKDSRSQLTFMDVSAIDGQGIVYSTYPDVLARAEALDIGEAYPHDRLHPLWTDDLSRVALNLYVNTGGVARSDIMMMDRVGLNPLELLHNARFIRWSPDGLHFLFFSGHEENVVNSRAPFDLYVGNSDNAGDSQMLLSGSEAAILLDTVRWLDGNTYIFQAVGTGSDETQLWRGVIGSPPLRLD